MAETPSRPDRKPPRFPFVAALLCAGGLGAAAWTWVWFSYCWDGTDIPTSTWRHVQYLSCRASRQRRRSEADFLTCEVDPGRDLSAWKIADGNAQLVVGRVIGFFHNRERGGVVREVPILSLAASRWHGGSIAGLVVAAMGVFVFTVALRHWLKERRART
jgi:hypothetical protein